LLFLAWIYNRKGLVHIALCKPKVMPLVYCILNLNIKSIPIVMKKSAIISSFEVRILLIIGSNMVVEIVIYNKQTSVSETVETSIEAKKISSDRLLWHP
jgi:hypothetical protein